MSKIFIFFYMHIKTHLLLLYSYTYRNDLENFARTKEMNTRARLFICVRTLQPTTNNIYL